MTMLVAGLIGCIEEPEFYGEAIPIDNFDGAYNNNGVKLDFGRDMGTSDAGDADPLDASVVDMGDRDMGTARAGAVRSMAFTDTSACAVTVDGRLFCWGQNHQAFIDPERNPDAVLPPTEIIVDTTFRQIEAGTGHYCATSTNGIWCWGDNTRGQADPRDATDLREPKLVADYPGGLSSAGATNCARDASGTYCWGAAFNETASNMNFELQLGLPTQELSVGDRYYCKYVTPNRVRCQGSNPDGRAGAGTTAVAGDIEGTYPNSVEIETDTFTCLLFNDTVHCVGDNELGQLGSSNTTDTAVTQTDLSPEQISVGRTHACTLQQNRNIECWGEWAPGVITRKIATVPAGDRGQFVNVFAGPQVTCASTVEKLYCWGENADYGLAGQFPGGNRVGSSVTEPTEVLFSL